MLSVGSTLDGIDPPPPVGARGFADFDAFEGDASDMARSANASFNFSYQYFLNKPGNNSFLHIQTDQGPKVDIHQTNKKIDANGTITGPGFTFDIQNVVGGSIRTQRNVCRSACRCNSPASSRPRPRRVLPTRRSTQTFTATSSPEPKPRAD